MVAPDGQKPVDNGSPERGALGIGPAESPAFTRGIRKANAHNRCSARDDAVSRA
jgi:hypothetical protein